jgi:hypothetical protein
MFGIAVDSKTFSIVNIQYTYMYIVGKYKIYLYEL